VSQPNASSGVLNCSHDSHRRCEHVTAVRVHLDGFGPELGSDDSDDLNAAEAGVSHQCCLSQAYIATGLISACMYRLRMLMTTGKTSISPERRCDQWRC
jgi:hypothetical protein